MIVSAIAAIAKNRVIGRDNQIPWYLPADLKWFKAKTLGHHVLMGRSTFESMGRPLPKRTNIVVTRNPFFIATGCLVVHSIEEGLAVAASQGEEEIFIIGGGQIYVKSMPFWDRIYLTEVDASPEGSVLFPAIDPQVWEERFREHHLPDEKNELAYTFRLLERRRATKHFKEHR